MNEYQELALKTCGTFDMDMRIMSALGLAGESGEVCDLVKKAAYHNHPIEFEKLEKEIGDVLCYVAILAQSHGFELEEIAQKNIEKLRKRYPDGFDVERSKNRQQEELEEYNRQIKELYESHGITKHGDKPSI